MKRDINILVAFIFAFGLIIWNGGCAKKVAPAPVAKAVEPAAVKPAPLPPPPVPTISLAAQPSMIAKGQSTVLSWKSSNATTVELDGGVGTVGSSGSVTVTPSSSVTYTAKATGPGGNSAASVRVTVEIPVIAAAPPKLSDREFFDKRIQDIFFDYDKYNIRNDQLGIAENDASALKERPTLKMMIEGHCDERGSEKYNLALGDRRANSVKSYLVDHGVPAERIDTVSYGKERPLDLGHNEEAWAKNRRGHFIMK
jgi:peptidoglycan-associated lipoprotein